MKPLPTRTESFIAGMIAGIILALAIVPAPARADGEHWVGLNTYSRHFTADNERYCEENWGLFYEYRWRPDRGVHVGYYRNSFCKRQSESRIDDTFYAVYLRQPWAFGEHDQLRVGGFIGGASGYEKGRLVVIGGALLTWTWEGRAGLQAIVNPAVYGQQVKARF